MPNFAFIDGQNLHLGITGLGWKLDWRRFRVYLGEHYDVARAYYFVGYIPDRQAIYTRLQDVGYSLVFKAVTYRGDGKPKGNVDAELVLQARWGFCVPRPLPLRAAEARAGAQSQQDSLLCTLEAGGS